jgi:hypothetical protein
MPYGEVNAVNLEFVANGAAPNVSTMTVKCIVTWPTPGTDTNPLQDHAELDKLRQDHMHLMRDQGKTDGIPVFVNEYSIARNFINQEAAEEFAGFLVRTCTNQNLTIPSWTIETI